MAYGNLPGGGFLGFVKAKEPLEIKKRSYLPIAEWPEEYKEYLDEESDTEPSLQEPEEAGKTDKDALFDLEYKSKEKPSKSQLKRKKTEGAVDQELELEIGIGKDIDKERERSKKLESEEKIYSKQSRKVRRDDSKTVSAEKDEDAHRQEYREATGEDLHPEKYSKTVSTKKPAKKVKQKFIKKVIGDDYPKIIATKKPDEIGEIKEEIGKEVTGKDLYPKRYHKTVRPDKKDKVGKVSQEQQEKLSSEEPTDYSETAVKKKESTIKAASDDFKDYSGVVPVLKDKTRKVRRGRKKTVTFDDENLEDFSEVPTTEEADEAKDDIAIEIEELEDKVSPLPEDEVSSIHPEIPPDEETEFRVKFRRPRKVLTYTYFKRKRSVFRFSPCVDRLLHSRRIEYRGLKAMLGFPIGALFGFALYWIVLERMGAEHYLCWLLGTCVGIGFALSTQVRCIFFLCIPACCGRAGRAFVSTYVVAYVMQGPLANILANSKESMRVISCTASLSLNHSAERFRLMFKPVKEIVVDFVGAGSKVQDDTKQLEKTFTNIEDEVRDEDEVKESIAETEELDDEIGGESRVGIIKKKFRKKKSRPQFGEDSEKNYGMKSEFRCEGVFNKGVKGCYDSFGRAYDRCHSYLPIIGYLLCWPMKLTFICDLASSMMGRRSCDSDDAMNTGFGASVDTADGVQSEFDKDFAVQLQYKLTVPEESVDQLVPEDVSGAMKYSYERRKKNLDFFTQLVDRVLAVLCLLVLNSSRKYCNQYLRIIQFDNSYVTSYFRHIDGRRKKKGKLVLLPLKKGEKVELSYPFTVRFAADERIKLIVSGITLFSEILTVSIILMFDRIFYEFLDLIKRHAHVTYKQTGVHHIKMTIYGDGFVGKMVRGILKGFDKKHSADQVTTTEECLPLPTKLHREMIIRLYVVFLLMLILIILESYALRLRRVICSFFYPKREKRRIIFLYNDRLKKRRSFLQHMRHRVREQAREQAIAIDSGVFFSLRKFYPKYFNWLSKLGLGLAQCLICNEKESNKCRLIACPECPFSYCSECWQDTEGKCYVCLPDDDTEPSEDSFSDE